MTTIRDGPARAPDVRGAVTTLPVHRPSTGRTRDGAAQEDATRSEQVRRRRGPGRRTLALREQRRARRRRRTRVVAIGIAGVALLVVAVVAVLRVGGRGADPTAAPVAGAGGPAAAATEGQQTLLLVRHADGAGTAQTITLLAHDGGGDGAIVFVPVGTLAEIPGYGLDRLEQAHQYGGADLVRAALENELGIEIDAAAAVSDTALGSLLQRVGGFNLDVPARLVARADDGTGELRFDVGDQYLDGPRLAEYWSFRQRDQSELDAFPRQQAVLDGLLRLVEDSALMDELAGRGLAQLRTDADADALRRLFAGLSAAESAGRLTHHLLPVETFGAADEVRGTSYRIVEDAATELVRAVLAGSIPAGGAGGAIPVQVLNGVGTPGIGLEVDGALQGGGFRIVQSENARSFDFAETRIVIYDEEEGSLRAAQRVRDLLGVGTIQVSRQPQSVVDVTIVVGADFAARSAGTPPPDDGLAPS